MTYDNPAFGAVPIRSLYAGGFSDYHGRAMPRPRTAWLVNRTGHRVRGGVRDARFTVQWYDQPGRNRRTRTFGTKRDAIAFLLAKTRDIQANLQPARLGLEDAVREFLGATGFLAEETQRLYAYTLRMFGQVAGHATPLVDLTSSHVDRFLTKPGRAESTAAKHFVTLRRFFRWCESRGYMHTVPTAGVTVRPRTSVRHLERLPDDNDIARLIKAIDSPRLKVAAALGLSTGLDRGVIASLSPDQIDLDAGIIRCVRKKTHRSRPTQLVIPIPQALLPHLADVVRRTPPGQALFAAYAQRPWYTRARAAAGEPWQSLPVAAFRKIASARLQRLVPLSAVQQILGHSTPMMTARHYSPADPEALRVAATLTSPGFQTDSQTTSPTPEAADAHGQPADPPEAPGAPSERSDPPESTPP